MTESDFKDIYRQHGGAVYRFAWRMTGSVEAAEDATQDCFAALWRSPDRYQASRGSVRAFLIGIARNVILKRWRHDQRWSPLDDETFTAEPLIAERLEAADLVGRAVNSLPPLQREVVVLFDYEGMTLEEIASTVAVDVGAVKARLHRARQNLRQMLACLRNSTCNL